MSIHLLLEGVTILIHAVVKIRGVVVINLHVVEEHLVAILVIAEVSHAELKEFHQVLLFFLIELNLNFVLFLLNSFHLALVCSLLNGPSDPFGLLQTLMIQLLSKPIVIPFQKTLDNVLIAYKI